MTLDLVCYLIRFYNLPASGDGLHCATSFVEWLLLSWGITQIQQLYVLSFVISKPKRLLVGKDLLTQQKVSSCDRTISFSSWENSQVILRAVYLKSNGLSRLSVSNGYITMKIILRTFCACWKNGAYLVEVGPLFVVGQYLRALCLKFTVTSRLYLGFHRRDISKISYLKLSAHALQTAQIWLQLVSN